MIKAANTTTDYLIDMWDAWIDVQDGISNNFTLNVVGEIYWQEKRIKPALVKRASYHNSKVLELEIRPGVVWEDGPVREIRYSEELTHPFQYKGVVIYLGDRPFVTIHEIDKVED